MLMYLPLAVALLGAVVWWKKSRNKSKESFLIPDIPKGTVVLHQYGSAPYVPSISPFVMKLETYLRVANIPYVNRYDRKPGPKGKIPWIQYNDDIIPDSQGVMEFLNKEFKVDLNRKLTNEQIAIGHVVRRTAEEWLYWVLVTFRVMFETNGTVYRQLGLPSLVIWYMRRAAKPRLLSQGIGRHCRQEVTSMMNDDLAAIDAILGDKKYLFGETYDDVTEFDCALFGQLCQLTWQMPDCGVEELIKEKYPRLVSYCQRMKEAFWCDWDERLKKTPAAKDVAETSRTPTSNSSSTPTTDSSSSSSKSSSISSSSSQSPSTLSSTKSSLVIHNGVSPNSHNTSSKNAETPIVKVGKEMNNNKNSHGYGSPSSYNNDYNINSNNRDTSICSDTKNIYNQYNEYSNKDSGTVLLAPPRKRIVVDQGTSLIN